MKTFIKFCNDLKSLDCLFYSLVNESLERRIKTNQEASERNRQILMSEMYENEEYSFYNDESNFMPDLGSK